MAALAGAVSGVPSTAWAVVRGADPRAATRAAGRMLLPGVDADAALIPAAAVVHAALSLGWAAVFAAVAPRRHATVAGAVFGAAVAALDLGIAHRSAGPRFAAVRALPVGPQVADHVVFGACVGHALGRDRLR